MDRRNEVFDFCDDEATEYASLSHRWVNCTEVDHEAVADLAQVNAEERDEICQCLIQEGSGYLSDRPKGTGMSGCGSTLATSTREAIQNDRRASVPWIAGIKTRWYAMHISMMYMALQKDNEVCPRSSGWREKFSCG